MSTLPLTPFDILSRNFFKADEAFAPALNSKQPHPLNIFHDDQGLYFEIACTGLTKKDIKIDIEGNELKIHYLKKEPEEQLPEGYIYHGLSKKSFSLGYKIAPKFNVDLTDAKLEHGLLKIIIPIAESAKKKTVTIN
jgi:HSP20 family protein|tara:strand:+ start:3089 stop:3499 length:411 start_codon:yes stop_codon:yes gene_type:complete